MGIYVWRAGRLTVLPSRFLKKKKQCFHPVKHGGHLWALIALTGSIYIEAYIIGLGAIPPTYFSTPDPNESAALCKASAALDPPASVGAIINTHATCTRLLVVLYTTGPMFFFKEKEKERKGN